MGMRGKRKEKHDGQTKFSESLIQEVLERWYLSPPKYLIKNLYVFDWESDYLAKTKSGYWYEVEIKISVADFKNDAKNKAKKFRILETGYSTPKQMFVQNPAFDKEAFRPNYFSYCVPDEMVDKIIDLVPSYAGLYSTDGRYLTCHKFPVMLHKDKVSDNDLNLGEKFYYNWRNEQIFNKTAKDRITELKATISELKATISWLKDEYKVATGCPIEDSLF